MIGAPRLVYLSALPATRVGDDAIVTTRKFIEGMERYAQLWGGPVRCVVPEASARTDNLDHIQVQRSDLKFTVNLLRAEELWEDYLHDASLVMVSLGPEYTHLAQWCADRKIPVLYVSELSVRTRLQIARAAVANPLRLARRVIYELGVERDYRKAVALSSGIQCNGTPTFRAYQSLSRDALLYFDSRSTEAMLATEQDIDARLARAQGKKIRLAFSGRLVPIKGVDHLVPMAAVLRTLGVDFSLSIFGGGSSEAAIREAITRQGLQASVKLEGTVDFATELTPRMRSEVDLFVCCHRQGDPSCTYLETMACGVPVVGYGNEAFTGLLEHTDAGRTVPMDDIQRLAESVASIARDRDSLRRWSHNALDFARAHTFEKTFERRMAHARRVCG